MVITKIYGIDMYKCPNCFSTSSKKEKKVNKIYAFVEIDDDGNEKPCKEMAPFIELEDMEKHKELALSKRQSRKTIALVTFVAVRHEVICG